MPPGTKVQQPEYGFTLAEFSTIQCSRCGDCCESFSLGNKGPVELLICRTEDYPTDRPNAMDFQLWLGGLIPALKPEGWRYACSKFQRDSGGLGVCTVHDTRPGICSEFPYGVQIASYDRCSFNVPVVGFID